MSIEVTEYKEYGTRKSRLVEVAQILDIRADNQTITDAGSILDAQNRKKFKSEVISRQLWTNARWNRANRIVNMFERLRPNYSGDSVPFVDESQENIPTDVQDRTEILASPVSPETASGLGAVAVIESSTVPDVSAEEPVAEDTVSIETGALRDDALLPEGNIEPEYVVENFEQSSTGSADLDNQARRLQEAAKRVSYVAKELKIEVFNFTDPAQVLYATRAVRHLYDLALEALLGVGDISPQRFKATKSRGDVLHSFMQGSDGKILDRLAPKEEDIGTALRGAIGFLQTNCRLNPLEWQLLATDQVELNKIFNDKIINRVLSTLEQNRQNHIRRIQTA